MEIKVLKELENVFFKRKDMEVEVAHEGKPTPKTSELKAELAGKYNVDESQVLVDYILTTRGTGKSKAKVKILKEKPEPKEEKTETKEAPKQEEKAEPEVKEEPKKEEKEAPAENKEKSGNDEAQTSEEK